MGALCTAGDHPVPSFSPLGGRTGSHLPGFTMCWAAGAARQGVCPAGAAQGNVDISWHSVSPQGTPKEWCVKVLFSARGNQ